MAATSAAAAVPRKCRREVFLGSSLLLCLRGRLWLLCAERLARESAGAGPEAARHCQEKRTGLDFGDRHGLPYSFDSSSDLG